MWWFFMFGWLTKVTWLRLGQISVCASVQRFTFIIMHLAVHTWSFRKWHCTTGEIERWWMRVLFITRPVSSDCCLNSLESLGGWILGMFVQDCFDYVNLTWGRLHSLSRVPWTEQGGESKLCFNTHAFVVFFWLWTENIFSSLKLILSEYLMIVSGEETKERHHDQGNSFKGSI